MTVRIFEDLASLSSAAANVFVKEAREAVSRSGKFTFALAGGNTPKALYHLLAEEPHLSAVEWDKVHAFFGDERWVPASDPSSNEGMAREALLSHVPIPARQVYPMYQGGSVEQACADYEEKLRLIMPSGLDLVLLGMGDDGHTASLFPGIPELRETTKWVVPTLSPKGVRQRVTLTFPALEMARSVLFLVSGADKHPELEKAVGGDPALWPPSGVLAHRSANASFFVDRSAAGSTVHDLG